MDVFVIFKTFFKAIKNGYTIQIPVYWLMQFIFSKLPE
jgi:hypothetical protein